MLLGEVKYGIDRMDYVENDKRIRANAYDKIHFNVIENTI
jgi:hypothetical protein